MSEVQETGTSRKLKPNRFRIIRIIVTMTVLCFIVSAFTPAMFGSRHELVLTATAQTTPGKAYTSGGALVSVVYSTYDRILTIANRVIDNGWYNGPVNQFVQAPNGDYLLFVREGTSHVGDNGSLKLYRSVNNALDFTMNATLRNITNRDVRVTASGVTETGRIFVFDSIYDPLNETWPTLVEYQYSDDNGAVWSGPINMSLPAVDGFMPNENDSYGGNIWGTMQNLGGGRIGLAGFFGNGTYVQERFIYSDDDGIIWHHVAMSSPTGPAPNFRSETVIIYLGDSRVVAIAREDATAGPDMFTSIDNGLTWAFRGYLPFTLPGGTMIDLALIMDTVGEPWILAHFSKGANHWYTVGYGDDCMNLGTTAWPDLTDITGYDPGDVWGGFPVTVFHADTGKGFIATVFETGDHANVLMFNLTASVTLLNYVDIVHAPVAFEIVHTEGVASCTYGDNTYVVSTSVGILFINMTIWNPTGETVAQWVASATVPDAAVTFTLSGLESGRMYRLYIDGVSSNLLTASGSGVVSFTYSGPWSEHQFEIVATSITGSISPLVNLIFIMFAIGIVVGVVAEGTNSLRKMQMRTSQQMIKSLVNMVVFIIIGIASLGVLYSMVI